MDEIVTEAVWGFGGLCDGVGHSSIQRYNRAGTRRDAWVPWGVGSLYPRGCVSGSVLVLDSSRVHQSTLQPVVNRPFMLPKVPHRTEAADTVQQFDPSTQLTAPYVYEYQHNK